MEDEKMSNQMLMQLLDMILCNQREMKERIDCILHAVCKSNDEKTRKAIGEYLGSNYRNNQCQ